MTGESTSIKMVLLDDRSFTTELDRAGYRKMGVHVRPAASYEEAEKILNSETIDVLVINMDYERADACQISRHLKAQPKHKELPIVITSVQTHGRARQSALEAGADLFVVQPLPRQYFIEKLKQLLEQKTRTTERIGVQGNATLTAGGKTHQCPIGDLSVTGILLSTNLEIQDGTKVEIAFDLPGYKKPITVSGEVVRTIKYNEKFPDRPTGIGVRSRISQVIRKNASSATLSKRPIKNRAWFTISETRANIETRGQVVRTWPLVFGLIWVAVFGFQMPRNDSVSRKNRLSTP